MKLQRSRDRRPGVVVAWAIVASLLLIATGVSVAGADGPSYVPNEYILKAAPGSSLSAVTTAVAQIGGSVVKPLPLANMYLVRMGTKGVAKSRFVSAVMAPTANVIQSFSPNYIYHKTVVPNDPDFNLQWPMGVVNLPRAWNTQKGSASVTVAVIDTGVANHPELQGRVLQGYDFVDNDADPSNDVDGHGTFCAGEIAALTDNGIGIAGVCWNGVNIMPIRVLGPGGGTTADCIAGMDWALTHKADVMSMSWGGPAGVADATIQAEVTKIATQSNIIMCAAAGNDGLNVPPSVCSPGLCPEVIAVAAIGPNDEIAYYSSYGPGNEVDIAAPGGDDLLGMEATVYGLLVTFDTNNVPFFDYTYMQGTSMACPIVAGAAALLLSNSVAPTDVRTRLQTSARKPKTGTMDTRKYGSGILDVAGAMSNGQILIVKPVKGSTVTSTPDFKFNVRGIDLNTLRVYLDYADGNGDDLPDDLSSETPVLADRDAIKFLTAAKDGYSFNWSDISATPLSSGLHFIYVTARTSGSGAADVYDWGTFNVSSRVLTAGTYLMSLPYASVISQVDGLRHPLPQELLWDATTSQPLDFRTSAASRARLLRWSAPEMSYQTYLPNADGNPSPNDRSWVNIISPTFNVPTGGGFLASDDTGTTQFPAGSGFWLILQRDAVLSNSFPVISASAGFSIYLYKGWNLIGNPYTHSIPLTSIKLTYQGRMRTLDEDAASPNPWVQQLFYGYTSYGVPGYVVVPSRGSLDPYSGYWIRSLVGGMLQTDRLLMTVQ